MKSKTKLKKEYSTIKCFIIGLTISMVLFGVLSVLFYKKNNFLFTACVNILTGLLTGLIILLFQYCREKNIRKINYCINNLKILQPVHEFIPQEKDFYDECYLIEKHCNNDENYKDAEWCDDTDLHYVLSKYKREIDECKSSFSCIENYCNNILSIIDTNDYKIQLHSIEKYFSDFFVQEFYNVYTDGTESRVCKYNNDNLDIISLDQVYKNWIHQMDTLSKATCNFNEDFSRIKISYIEKYEKLYYI